MKILLLIDVQKGFLDCLENQKDYEQSITSLLSKYDKVIATKFINQDNSSFVDFLNWKKMFIQHHSFLGSETDLLKSVEDRVDVVLTKYTYSAVNPEFLQVLSSLNNGQYPDEVYLAGMDTDGCVLATALGLFDHHIKPIILKDFCQSSGGWVAHKAGLACLMRNIGKENVV